MARCLLLLSGGLDSTLAARLLVEMGIGVEAVHFTSPFCRCTPASWGCSAAHLAAGQAGIKVHSVASGQDYLDVMKKPRFGRGSQMNACIDCRIFMFSRARDLMAELGMDFIATGEVLGQRPMSQRRDAMRLIERESGLTGLIVRPLCAQLMPPSVPEQKGWVSRERLLALHGRSRKGQMALAAERGMNDYPCPAGGCLLNDPQFAPRFKDLLDRQPDFNLADARLLRWGRHFRLPGGVKAIVGRDEKENQVLENARAPGAVLMVPVDVPGPSVLLPGGGSEADFALAAGLLAAYTKAAGPVSVRITGRAADPPEGVVISAAPLSRNEAAQWLVGAAAGTVSSKG
jgi:tRNA U34 2-thiouridine synthase MnmA/TrmU